MADYTGHIAAPGGTLLVQFTRDGRQIRTQLTLLTLGGAASHNDWNIGKEDELKMLWGTLPREARVAWESLRGLYRTAWRITR